MLGLQGQATTLSFLLGAEESPNLTSHIFPCHAGWRYLEIVVCAAVVCAAVECAAVVCAAVVCVTCNDWVVALLLCLRKTLSFATKLNILKIRIHGALVKSTGCSWRVLRSVPSTHVSAPNRHRGSSALFWPLRACGAHHLTEAHLHKNTYTL